MVRRHPAALGVHARLAPRAVGDRPRPPLCRRPGRGPVPQHRRRLELAGACRAARARVRAALAARRGWHVPAHHRPGPRARPGRITVAISAAGVFPLRRRGSDVAPDQPRACCPTGSRRRQRRSGTASTTSRCIRSGPDVLYMQKHWDVMRSDDAGGALARGERQPAQRLRIPDRGACARTRDGVRRSDHQRFSALSTRRPPARLPQPQRWRRVAGPYRGSAAAGLLRRRAPGRDGRRHA